MDNLNNKNAAEIKNTALAIYREYGADEDKSKAVAGMMAIIRENDAAYEGIRNQKWFQRIWKNITGQNKATIKQMQEKRDILTRYTVQIIAEMINMFDEHSDCIYDLYRVTEVIKQQTRDCYCIVEKLAHKLNERITSVDNFHLLAGNIRNKKFNGGAPLVSLIDIMSQIDFRTATDQRKLDYIKDTMVESGFDFSKKVDVDEFKEELLLLPKDKIGRILLFCQNHSHVSPFIDYAGRLIENCCNMDTGEFTYEERLNRGAMFCANLDTEQRCNVEDLFSSLETSLKESFAALKSDGKVYINGRKLIPADYYRSKTNKRCNIIVVGTRGSGKSTLINSILGYDVAETERSRTDAKGIAHFEQPDISFYELSGFALDDMNSKYMDDLYNNFNVQMTLLDKKNTVLWYCLNQGYGKYHTAELDFIKKLSSSGVPVIIVVTRAVAVDNGLVEEVDRINKSNNLMNVSVVKILAKGMTLGVLINNESVNVPAYGLEDLIDKTIEVASL